MQAFKRMKCRTVSWCKKCNPSAGAEVSIGSFCRSRWRLRRPPRPLRLPPPRRQAVRASAADWALRCRCASIFLAFHHAVPGVCFEFLHVPICSAVAPRLLPVAACVGGGQVHGTLLFLGSPLARHATALHVAAAHARRLICQALGNALFFGSLGTGAFFGYYTLRYTADQVETMVEQTQAPENSFPGSSVRHTPSQNSPGALSSLHEVKGLSPYHPVRESHRRASSARPFWVAAFCTFFILLIQRHHLCCSTDFVPLAGERVWRAMTRTSALCRCGARCWAGMRSSGSTSRTRSASIPTRRPTACCLTTRPTCGAHLCG